MDFWLLSWSVSLLFPDIDSCLTNFLFIFFFPSSFSFIPFCFLSFGNGKNHFKYLNGCLDWTKPFFVSPFTPIFFYPMVFLSPLCSCFLFSRNYPRRWGRRVRLYRRLSKTCVCAFRFAITASFESCPASAVSRLSGQGFFYCSPRPSDSTLLLVLQLPPFSLLPLVYFTSPSISYYLLHSTLLQLLNLGFFFFEFQNTLIFLIAIGSFFLRRH